MRRPIRRRPLSMTSLIDVIFLLLMFFMLASTFTRTTELPFSAGAAGQGSVAQSKLVFVRLGPDSLSLNGTALTFESLVSQLHERKAPHVLVSLGAQVDSQRLADLLIRLKSVPGLQVQVLG